MSRKTKIISLFLAITLLCGFLFSCKAKESVPDGIKVMVLSGTTGMGISYMMEQTEIGKSALDCNFEIVSAADVVSAAIISGEVDIAAVPTNLAAVLYNKTNGGVKCIAVNTLGVLWLLENGNSVSSFNDLKGKTVYLPGLGSNPEYIFRYLCEENGISVGEDVNLDGSSYPSPDELTTAIASGLVDLALLPEPKVTAITMQNTNVRKALDMTSEWSKVSDSKLVQGCLVVRTEFAEKYKSTLDKFLDEYEKSVEYVLNNVEESAALMEKYGIIPKAALAKKAIPNCNITFISGEKMANDMTGFLTVLYSMNPKAVGGKLPDDDLYYNFTNEK